jgi:hypothetical protein
LATYEFHTLQNNNRNNKLRMTIVQIENRGRKKDAIRRFFPCIGKISTCVYCHKTFSSATTLALKGHFAGDGFHKIQKTTACPGVPIHIKNYYIHHMKTRKRSKTAKSIMMTNANSNNVIENENKVAVDCSNDTLSIDNNQLLDENQQQQEEKKEPDDTVNITEDTSLMISPHSTAYEIAFHYFLNRTLLNSH